LKECTACGTVSLDTDAACGVCGSTILRAYDGNRIGSDNSIGSTKTASTPRKLKPSVVLIPVIVFSVFGLLFWLTASSPYNRFSAGIYTLLVGLLITGSYVGRKAQSERSFYILTAPRSPPRVFPKNSPEPEPSQMEWVARTSAALTADIIGVSIVLVGILLMLT